MKPCHQFSGAAIFLSVGLLLTGCGGDSTALSEKIEDQARVIDELESTLAEARASHASESEALRTELADAHRRELDDLGSTLRRQVNEHSRTIAGLREQLASVERPAAPPPVAPPVEPAQPAEVATPAISVYSPPEPDLDKFIVPPSGPDADLFPVAIDAIQGERVVIGSHMTSRMVETGEVVKDKYGEEKPLMRPEPMEIQDYDHQARFTAHNRTRDPVRLTYRAGRERLSVTLASGETTECQVASLVGASLTVAVGSETRNFPVIYP